jgi:general secretion pathway protein L
VIARRASIEDGLAAAAACGVVPEAIDCVCTDGRAAGVDLIAAMRGSRERGGVRLDRMLVAMAILLAVAAPLAVILRNEQALDGLEARIAASRERALAMRAAEERASGAAAAAASWIGRRRKQPYAAELWLEVTRLLPDDAHAEALSIEGATLAIDGQAQAAAGLVPLLEASTLLAGVAFASPVVLDPATGKERFSLKATIAIEAAP